MVAYANNMKRKDLPHEGTVEPARGTNNPR